MYISFVIILLISKKNSFQAKNLFSFATGQTVSNELAQKKTLQLPQVAKKSDSLIAFPIKDLCAHVNKRPRCIIYDFEQHGLSSVLRNLQTS